MDYSLNMSARKQRKRHRRDVRPKAPEVGLFELRAVPEAHWPQASSRRVCLDAALEYIERVERAEKYHVIRSGSSTGRTDPQLAQGKRGARSASREIENGLAWLVPRLSAREKVDAAERSVDARLLPFIKASLFEGRSLAEIGAAYFARYRQPVPDDKGCRRQAVALIARGLEQMARSPSLGLLGGRPK